MRAAKLLALLLAISVAHFAQCDDFDDTDDDGVTVEVEKEAEEDSRGDKIYYISPSADSSKYHFADHFDDPQAFEKKWVKSSAKKNDASEEIAMYDGIWALEAPVRTILERDLGLVLKSKAKHAAISSRFNKPFVFGGKPLIVQYEVTLQEGQECGGSYIKLLSKSPENSELSKFHDKSPYTIMFGPDKCGNDVKLHFIFRHVNPKNGSIEEKHAKKPKERLEEPFKDKQPHLYKLVLNPDNSFRIYVDNKLVNDGHLLNDLSPPINPPKEIDDPEDKKPEDWDEREKIPDPSAVKPEDWDVPAQIPDPSAVKPENWIDDLDEMIPDETAVKPDDWDEEIDGTWEAPLVKNPLCEDNGCGKWEPAVIPNPEYRGKWRAPLLDNPNYRGKWAPRRIPNPDFFEDIDPFARFTSIDAVGIELWSMSNDILFDNVVITDEEAHAAEWASMTFDLKRKQIDSQANTFWGRMMRKMNYKPGYYLTYFIYCMIPVSIYVTYLWRRRQEDFLPKDSFVQKMKKMFNDSPWIVAIIVIVVGLPVFIIVYMLCSANSSSKDKPSDNKKTDDYTEDDAPAAAAALSSSSATPRPKSKLDLNEPEFEESEGEVQEQPEEEEEPVEEVKASEPAPRKRKARKD